MSIKKFTTPLSALLILFSSVAWADEPAVMKLVRENYNPGSHIHATFDHTIYWSIREREEKKSGEIFLAPGEKFRVVLGDDIVVSDGTSYWQYSGKNSQVQIYNLSDVERTYHPSSLLSSYLTREDFRESAREKGVIVLETKEEDRNYTLIKAWVEEKQGIITKLQLTDKNGNINTYNFTKTRFGNHAPASTFRFNPPKNTDIHDMREGNAAN